MAFKDEILKMLDESLTWEDAFNKFGYEDGDGTVLTWDVVKFLQFLGYTADAETWGIHNCVINTLIAPDGGVDLLEHATVGYDDPREYLPLDLIKQLDEWFYGKAN
jgi:hypothetical protein